MQPHPFEKPVRNWRKVTLQVPQENSEAVAGCLATLSGHGVEIASAENGCEKIIAYLEEDADQESRRLLLDSFLQELQASLPADKPLRLHVEHLPEEDWGKGWKSHFKAVRLTPRLAIKPSWESYVPEGAESVIELDPGMAFGTGLHASTRLALELIEECFPVGNQGPGEALDVGTGTGILAMACALLGAKRVTALDNDPEAIRVATENIRANHLEDSIEASGLDLTDLRGRYGLVIANIIHDTLIELAPVLCNRAGPNGFLILAGILQGEQEKSILAAFRTFGFIPLDIRYREEWVAFRLTPIADAD